MDVLLRLRVLIWILVISLWGVMVYEYLGEEEKDAQTMHQVVNPYRSVDVAPAETPTAEPAVSTAAAAAAPAIGAVAAVPPSPESATPADPSANVVPLPDAVGPAASAVRRAPTVVARPEATAAHAARRAARAAAKRQAWREDRNAPVTDPPVPPGFKKTVTRHFNVYAEEDEASDQFVELIENLHANLMLDLAPFSPWASDQRVSIFLFKNQETYRRVTGRPPWSGGASSTPKRKVYVYESEELPGILAHELTHIYFDSFFLDGVMDPLWLSEGMATLVQVERGLAAPNWLRENLVLIESGGGMSIDPFMAAKTTAGWPDERVRLWYAQAYSLVRYLIRAQFRSSFYKFAAGLRDGRPTAEALYRAYGAPYTRLRALELAWRHEISRGGAPEHAPAGPRD